MLATLLLIVAAVPLAHCQQLFEGSKCTSTPGTPGVCRRLTNCPWAMEEVRKGRRPKVCLYQGPFAVVCCPGKSAEAVQAKPDKGPKNPSSVGGKVVGRVARKKCKEYASYVFAEQDSMVLMPQTERVDQCAASADPLIVGGTQAKAMEFPHMALIGYGNAEDVAFQCGGSLVAPKFVLTAAHCLFSGDSPARWVLVGELDRATDKDDARPQRLAVAERIKHPQYKPPATYNDIALLRLKDAPQLDGYVRPACLHTEPHLRTRVGSSNEPEEVPVATGWGNTDWEGDPSNILMKVALREADHEKCSKSYANSNQLKLPRGIQADSQLCAGGKAKDTCQGDSGGPLQVSTRNVTRDSDEPYCMYKIVGVTSFGQACGFNAPGVYSRVYHYVSWIESIVWPGE